MYMLVYLVILHPHHAYRQRCERVTLPQFQGVCQVEQGGDLYHHLTHHCLLDVRQLNKEHILAAPEGTHHSLYSQLSIRM